MWLAGRLVPNHTTIADFRKNNGPAIRKVCGHEVAAILGFSLDPDDRAFSSILKAKTTSDVGYRVVATPGLRWALPRV
jgi:hypothetical protein